MKKSFLAMLLLGSTMSMFAQNTQTGTTGNQTGTTTQGNTTTTGTTQQSTGVTGDPTTTTGENVSNMNNNAMSGTTNNGTTGTTGTWNGVSTNSTSWTPERDPSWGWNSHGIWDGTANANRTSVNGSVDMNNGTQNQGNMNNTNMNTDASMSSTGNYSAYGTAVPYLPQNVQMRFNQDFPTSVNNSFSWKQYGDWFHSYHLNNGRLIQYFYDSKGAGYSLALPVLQSYVPENIVTSALNKYGSNLYSISMVKTADGKEAYQIGLIQGGQINMQYLDESGATVANVWRVDSLDNAGTMMSTQTNAAMGTDVNSDMNNNQNGMNNQNGLNNNSMNNNQSSNTGEADEIKVTEDKVKIEHADGTETKIKIEEDEIKIKKDGKKTKIKREQQ